MAFLILYLLKLEICSESIFIVLHTKISAIKQGIDDKSAIKQDIGDKSAINNKEKILEYLEEHAEARTQEISLYIGLKLSRTKDYLSELVEEGNIIANGANKNRTYSLKK